MSRIFKTTENVYNPVDAVVKFGYAAVDGTKTPALAYCGRILNALSVYSNISARISYLNVAKQGYLYYVFDSSRFDLRSVEQLIKAIDEKSSI